MFGNNKKTLQSEGEISCSIRAIVGIGNNMIQGLGLLYKKPEGHAGLLNVWEGEDLFKLICFIDEGESRIVWKSSTWSDGTTDKAISHIYIR